MLTEKINLNREHRESLTSGEILLEAYWMKYRREQMAKYEIASFFTYKALRFKEPSYSWLKGFCNRNSVEIKKDRGLKREKDTQSGYDSMKKWAEKMWKAAVEDVDPRFLFNFDEVVVEISTKNVFVGAKEAEKISHAASKPSPTHITVISTISAAGESLPDLVIIPRENMQNIPKLLPAFPHSAIVGTPSGCSNLETLELFIGELIKHIEIKREATKYPGKAVLFCDSHTAKINQDILAKLLNVGIYVVKESPRTIQTLQPIELVLSRSFKEDFGTKLREIEKMNYAQESLSKQENSLFSQLLAALCALQQSTVRADVVANWKSSNLFPLNMENLLSSSKVSKETENTKKSELNIAGGVLSGEEVDEMSRKRKTPRPNQIRDGSNKSGRGGKRRKMK